MNYRITCKNAFRSPHTAFILSLLSNLSLIDLNSGKESIRLERETSCSPMHLNDKHMNTQESSNLTVASPQEDRENVCWAPNPKKLQYREKSPPLNQ